MAKLHCPRKNANESKGQEYLGLTESKYRFSPLYYDC